MSLTSVAASLSSSVHPSAYVPRAMDRIKPPLDLSPEVRAALADMASVLRNVRYDMAKTAPKSGSRFNEGYVQEIGMQILEVADTHLSLRARDWDTIIKQLLQTR